MSSTNLNIARDSSKLDDSQVEVGHVAGGSQQTVNIASSQQQQDTNDRVHEMHTILAGDEYGTTPGLVRTVKRIDTHLWALTITIIVILSILFFQVKDISQNLINLAYDVNQLRSTLQEYINAGNQALDR